MKRRLHPGAASALMVVPTTLKLVNAAPVDATKAPARSALNNESRSADGALQVAGREPVIDPDREHVGKRVAGVHHRHPHESWPAIVGSPGVRVLIADAEEIVATAAVPVADGRGQIPSHTVHGRDLQVALVPEAANGVRIRNG